MRRPLRDAVFGRPDVIPSPRRRQDVKNQVGSWLVGRVARVVHGRVVKHPQLTLAHHDRFATRCQRTPFTAPQHKVEAVADAIVGPGVDVRSDPPMRLQGNQCSASELTLLEVGYPLTELR